MLLISYHAYIALDKKEFHLISEDLYESESLEKCLG